MIAKYATTIATTCYNIVLSTVDKYQDLLGMKRNETAEKIQRRFHNTVSEL